MSDRDVLSDLQDPQRYRRFLDEDPAAGDDGSADSAEATGGTDEAHADHADTADRADTAERPDAADRPRDLGGVAARLAAALTRAEEPRKEPAEQPKEPKQQLAEEPKEAEEPPAAPAPHHRLQHPVLRAPSSTLRGSTPRGPTTQRGPTTEPDPARVAHYLAHSADLTLVGGLEAAVAAGPAVCALAEQYALRRIGGSSTTAVAAAFAAAAELGRTAPPAGEVASDGVPPGFAGLAGAVAWLAAPIAAPERSATGVQSAPPERLVRMFRPDGTSAPLFRVLMAMARPRRRGVAGPVTRLTEAALTVLDRPARVVVGLLWLGALAGAAGVITALVRSPQVAGMVVAVAAVPLAVTFALAAALGTAVVAVRAVWAAVRPALTADGFGLVPGSADADAHDPPEGLDGPDDESRDRPPTGDDPAVVDWIADRLDDLAGVPPATGATTRYAVTFGELWLGRTGGRAGADVRALRRAATDARRRVVDLQLVTADLSSGRPRLLPFGATERAEQIIGTRFAFCRSCLVGLLPARVVDQMVLMSPDVVAGASCPRHDGQPLHDLPDPEDLPVAFAVRLAASTPLLLRPVPLHRADPGSGVVRTHWFGDGAATGGLPAGLFDAPLPRWPAFSIGAVAASSAGDDADVPGDDADVPGDDVDVPGDDVDVPGADARPAIERWRSVAHGPAGLVAALLTSAVGWRCAVAMSAPGLRGRTAVVRGTEQPLPFLDADGVAVLAGRGYRAGVALRERFTSRDCEAAPESDAEEFTGTDRFRWIRMRAALTEYRQLSLAIGASIPLYTDLALAYRVPAELSGWFSPALTPGHGDPAWGDAVAAITHLRSLTEGGVLDWDTDWGAPPSDPHERLV